MSFWKDIRFARRTLTSHPGFLLVATLSMALGIGANTAIVSLIDSVLWQTLPVSNPRELVLLDYEMQPGVRSGMHNGWIRRSPEGTRISTSFKYPSFQPFQQHDDLFPELFAFAPLDRANLSFRDSSEIVEVQMVSGGYFHGLGLKPFLGRLIESADDRVDAPPVMVLHYDYWQSRFGADPALIGEVVHLNQRAFTVVGIAPPGFQGTLQIGSEVQVSVPISSGYDLSPFSRPLSDEDYWWVRIMGRPQPGVSRARIEGVLSNLVTANLATPPKLDPANDAEFPVRVRLQDGSQGLQEQRAELRTPLFAVSGVAALVLLLCCANVAGLLVARGAGRQREMSVRLSLGATRWRLIRQQLVESTLIAAGGALIGLLVALALQRLLAAQFSSHQETLNLELSLNWKVLSVTGLLAAASGLLFGLAPALRGSAVDPVRGLKQGALNATASPSRLWLGRVLVASQVALSVLVLGTAGLFLETLRNLRSVDVGFDPENVLLFRVDPKLNGYEAEAQLRLQQQMREHLSAIPGVRALATVDFSPVGSAGRSTSGLRIEGQEGEFSTDIVTVSDNFFSTLNIPIQVGRSFQPTDIAGSPRVAVVSAELARQYLGRESPIGKRIKFDEKGSFEIEIVGVAGDVKNRSLRASLSPVVYLAEKQAHGMFYATFALRTRGDPNSLVPQVREAVQEVDPNLPVFDLKLYRDQIAQSFHSELQFARLTSIFGLVGLALACIGLYGILSHAVAQRTREFGIRIALGAGRSRLVALVMKEIYLVAVGVTAGLILSFFATRAVGSLLYGLSPADPTALGGAALVMFLSGSLAAYLPARKASATDPLLALRAE